MLENEKFQFDEYAKPNFEPYEGKENFIFASYAHKGNDPKKVIPLLNMMNKNGFRIWYDRGIYFGDDYHEKIANRIHDCTMFIAFVSKDSLAPTCYCNMEIDFAVSEKFSEKNKKGKQIAAIFLEDLIEKDGENLKENREKKIVTLTPKQRMQFLATNQAGKLFDYDNLETFYSILVNNSDAILSCCGKILEPINVKDQIPPTDPPVDEHNAHHMKLTEKFKKVLKNSISWFGKLSKKQKVTTLSCLIVIFIMGVIWNWRYGVPGTDSFLPPKHFDGFELASSCTAEQFQRALLRWETSRDFNFMNNQGYTALYVAAEKNIHPDAIKLMLNETKKLGEQEYEKRINKALEIAIENNPNPEVIKIFVDDGSVKPRMAVFLAAKNNTNINVIKFLLENEDTTRRNLILDGIVRYDGKTLLSYAAHNFNNEVLRYVIKSGANVNAVNLNGETALMELYHNYMEYNAIKIKDLLDVGADPNIQDSKGETILMKIMRDGLYTYSFRSTAPIEVLISKGASVDIKDNKGRTALMHSINNEGWAQHIDEMRVLLNNGADVNARDNDDNTALIDAVKFKSLDTVQLLMKYGADINAKDNNGRTALMKLMQRDVFYQTKLEIIKLLLENGADTTIQDNDGKTALMYAILSATRYSKKYWTFHRNASRKEKLEIETSIIKTVINSSDVDIQDNQGRTALMNVITHRLPFENMTNIELLLKAGTDINARDNEGNTALILILKLIIPPSNIRYALIKLLLDAGANRDLRDKSGNLAFHYALKCIAFFSEKELSPYKGDAAELAEKGTLAQVKEALYEGAYFGTYQSRTIHATDTPDIPIFSALKNSDPEVFKFILNNGLGISERVVILNGTYKNILMSILYQVAVRKPNPDILKFLIEAGCNLNGKYDGGRNILMEAVRISNNIDVIKILAESGIDVKAKDDNEKTAADYAMENEYLKNSGLLNKIMEILSSDISK